MAQHTQVDAQVQGFLKEAHRVLSSCHTWTVAECGTVLERSGQVRPGSSDLDSWTLCSWTCSLPLPLLHRARAWGSFHLQEKKRTSGSSSAKHPTGWHHWWTDQQSSPYPTLSAPWVALLPGFGENSHLTPEIAPTSDPKCSQGWGPNLLVPGPSRVSVPLFGSRAGQGQGGGLWVSFHQG